MHAGMDRLDINLSIWCQLAAFAAAKNWFTEPRLSLFLKFDFF